MHLRKATLTAVVPFSGLGFDLTGATLAANGMRLARHDMRESSFMATQSDSESSHWGFELMIFLGRETGGS